MDGFRSSLNKRRRGDKLMIQKLSKIHVQKRRRGGKWMDPEAL
jgi:hypothetical protein